MKNYKLITFDKIGKKEVGYLTALEENKNIPFGIKRVYYVYDVPENIVRGYHAHKKLEQILICINGSVSIKLFNGIQEEVIVMSEPSVGLYMGPYIWREIFDFSEGCVLLVLASEYYDEDDYIRDYKSYLEEVKERF